jgi:6-phosphogluconate dehydrogenase
MAATPPRASALPGTPSPSTTPLEHPERYQYDLPIGEITELWRRGSVIGSWLLDLTAALYQRFSSRGRAEFGAEVLSAMRFEFGGHEEKKAGS